MKKLKLVHNIIYGFLFWEIYVKKTFSGLKPADDILTFLKLLISKNPENDIGTMLAFKGKIIFFSVYGI